MNYSFLEDDHAKATIQPINVQPNKRLIIKIASTWGCSLFSALNVGKKYNINGKYNKNPNIVINTNSPKLHFRWDILEINITIIKIIFRIKSFLVNFILSAPFNTYILPIRSNQSQGVF